MCVCTFPWVLLGAHYFCFFVPTESEVARASGGCTDRGLGQRWRWGGIEKDTCIRWLQGHTSPRIRKQQAKAVWMKCGLLSVAFAVLFDILLPIACKTLVWWQSIVPTTICFGALNFNGCELHIKFKGVSWSALSVKTKKLHRQKKREECRLQKSLPLWRRIRSQPRPSILLQRSNSGAALGVFRKNQSDLDQSQSCVMHEQGLFFALPLQ